MTSFFQISVYIEKDITSLFNTTSIMDEFDSLERDWLWGESEKREISKERVWEERNKWEIKIWGMVWYKRKWRSREKRSVFSLFSCVWLNRKWEERNNKILKMTKVPLFVLVFVCTFYLSSFSN